MIRMKSEKHQVISVKKKTQAKMFKDIKPGDILEFSIEIKTAGRGDSGTLASYIKTRNVTRDMSVYKTFNQLPLLLDNFELVEVY